MKDGITLSFGFIDKYVRFTKPDYLQVFLYIKAECERGGEFPSAESIAKALDMPSVKAEFILEYWASRGEIEFEGGKYRLCKPSSKSAGGTAAKAAPARQSKHAARILSKRDFGGIKRGQTDIGYVLSGGNHT